MVENLADTNVGNIEYIRKQDVLNLPQNIERNLRGEVVERSIDVKAIESLLSADVAPVVHSRWIKTADGAECEICGREAVYQIVDDYWEYEPWCPHCGAKMDGEGEE